MGDPQCGQRRVQGQLRHFSRQTISPGDELRMILTKMFGSRLRRCTGCHVDGPLALSVDKDFGDRAGAAR